MLAQHATSQLPMPLRRAQHKDLPIEGVDTVPPSNMRLQALPPPRGERGAEPAAGRFDGDDLHARLVRIGVDNLYRW